MRINRFNDCFRLYSSFSCSVLSAAGFGAASRRFFVFGATLNISCSSTAPETVTRFIRGILSTLFPLVFVDFPPLYCYNIDCRLIAISRQFHGERLKPESAPYLFVGEQARGVSLCPYLTDSAPIHAAQSLDNCFTRILIIQIPPFNFGLRVIDCR